MCPHLQETIVTDSPYTAGEANEKPTPRAIRERLVKIRQIVKNGGGTGTGSTASTPRKPAGTAAARTPISGGGGGSGKRKQTVSTKKPIKRELTDTDTDDSESDLDVENTPSKKLKGQNDDGVGPTTPKVKKEHVDDDGASAENTPSKRSRTRTPRALPAGMVNYNEGNGGESSDGANDIETSSDEYLPERLKKNVVKIEEGEGGDGLGHGDADTNDVEMGGSA